LKKINSNEFAIKFLQSDLSIQGLEELLYQRDCLISLVEKTYESLHVMSEKFLEMENQIKAVRNSASSDTKLTEVDSQKFKDLLK
jgi:hypothetical protein